MIIEAMRIDPPYDGEYRERIYDIRSVWNSSDWTWIRFTEDDGEEWCGEFRGEYKGAVVSDKLGVAVVLTSDHMYMLDIKDAEITDCLSQPDYEDIACSPLGDIFMTDGYRLEMLTGNRIARRKSIPTPVRPDSLRFSEWKGSVLKMTCDTLLDWDRGWEMRELFLDSVSLQWSEHA